jgi:prevent-host-death family protein
VRASPRSPRHAKMATIMATKTVGIRELKNAAPKLVQRVERGERFVITRHGRAAAELAPVSGQRPPAGRERLREWQRERDAFRRMAPRLARRLAGLFAAVHRGRVIDSDADPMVLFDRVAQALRGRTFFIGRVGDPDAFVDMPGFEVE